MKYQIPPNERTECTAWAKAPADVHDIALRKGFADLPVNLFFVRRKTPFCRFVSLIRWTLEMRRVRRALCPGDILLIQSRSRILERRSGRRFFESLARKGVRLIQVVHDIDALRVADESQRQVLQDEFLWMTNLCEKSIVHNERMKAWCVEHGIPVDKLFVLGLFDYLMPLGRADLRVGRGCPPDDDFGQHEGRASRTVVVAGNLDSWKAGYLTQLNQVPDIEWNLYGPNFDSAWIVGANVHYVGAYSPEELPEKLEGRFGLVWDGESIDSCSGPSGEYLRYNNPHKLSLYLASGLPVIVWRKSAVAEFVEKERLGCLVDSLREIPKVLSGIADAAYREMRRSVLVLTPKLREGAFMRTALNSVKDGC